MLKETQHAHVLQEPPEAMVLEPPEANAAGQPNALEALLSGQGNFPAMFIPPDADDETMVELAIALSLQDQVFCFHCTIAFKIWVHRQKYCSKLVRQL